MLKSLSIRNYAIIDDIRIDLTEGMNVFTGETGAGKSILVGALSLLLKGRSDTSMIRKGEKKAFIEGVFSVDEELRSELEEADIEADDEIIVRRVLSSDGHSSIRINDISVTLGFLESLFEDRVDIHSQRDNQYLYKSKNHITLLDRFAGNEVLLSSYRSAYDNYRSEEEKLRKMKEETFSERELEFLRYDLEELEKASLDPEEEEELQRKEKLAKDSERYISSLNSAMDLYKGEGGIREKLYDMIRLLHLDDERIDEVRDTLNTLYYALDDETEKLGDYLRDITDEDLSIDQIEERLFLYSRLKRKHNTDVKGLLALQNDIADKIALFTDKDAMIAKQEKIALKAREEAMTIAEKLHEIRSEKAKELSAAVEKECGDLLLENASFRIDIKNKDLSPKGIDDVEFCVAMNKGDDFHPLKNVVSGGEASRLLLSLKTIFSRISGSTLVVFDEIDNGISGRVARRVGEKMAEISKDVQVLTITHLAAVAAYADSHYYIYKEVIDDKTVTGIRKLNEEEIIEELASISGDLSENAVKAAGDLYRKAQEEKGS